MMKLSKRANPCFKVLMFLPLSPEDDPFELFFKVLLASIKIGSSVFENVIMLGCHQVRTMIQVQMELLEVS